LQYDIELRHNYIHFERDKKSNGIKSSATNKQTGSLFRKIRTAFLVSVTKHCEYFHDGNILGKNALRIQRIFISQQYYFIILTI